MNAPSRYRGYVLLTLVYAILFGGYVLYERWPRPEPVRIINPTSAPTCTPVPIQVYVVGAVQRPGVYELAPESRVVRAIEAAGGLSADAEEAGVNLADHLRDGQQIYVPYKGAFSLPSPTPSGASSSGGASLSSRADGVININTASAAELATLPGIGTVLAERIIAYRQARGPFTDPAQLMDVKGIGEGLYERIRGRVTVR